MFGIDVYDFGTHLLYWKKGQTQYLERYLSRFNMVRNIRLKRYESLARIRANSTFITVPFIFFFTRKRYLLSFVPF